MCCMALVSYSSITSTGATIIVVLLGGTSEQMPATVARAETQSSAVPMATASRRTNSVTVTTIAMTVKTSSSAPQLLLLIEVGRPL